MRALLSAMRRRAGRGVVGMHNGAAGEVPDAEIWRSMSGIMAHDLRAPAAAILALSDLQRLGVLPGGVFAEQVARQARQALALTDELAALLREPLHPYRMAPVDLIGMLRHRIEARWPADGAGEDGAPVLPRLAMHPREAWVMADARMLADMVDVILDRACLGGGGGGGVEVSLTAAATGLELAIRARVADGPAAGTVAETVADVGAAPSAGALSASAPAGLLVRRILHRHGGALLACGARLADGTLEWRLALPARARRAPNKKAPEGAFLPSVA